MTTDGSPLLIYDGDCGFCGYWVRYWQRLTLDKVDYAPYQQVGARFSHIPLEQFRHAIFLISPDGVTFRSAAAAFQVLNHAGHGAWWWLYRHMPLFAWISERCYDLVARRRGAAHRVSRWLWGRERIPDTFEVAAWLLLRGLGLIYLFAFASFAIQVKGLIGGDGILPLQHYLNLVHSYAGTRAYWLAPTVLWLNAGDTALQAICWMGAAFSVLLTAGLWQKWVLPLLYILYLSLMHAGQDFMTYQWDLLLLEAGFLAIFLPYRSSIVTWLFRWLTFRFMFMAGAAKIVSGDLTWRNLTALNYHFETQPLPTPIAWYVHQAPACLLEILTAATLAVEMGVVFLIFLPRRPRMLAAWCIIALESLIFLTGNYNFFNLLVVVLCVSLFDDQALARRWLPGPQSRPAIGAQPQPSKDSPALRLLAVLLVVLGLTEMEAQLTRRSPPAGLATLREFFQPLFIVNGYGLFANMTTRRPEIIVEGSNNSRVWMEYEFKYKPGNLNRPPLWNVPHQPRLDWQMWFAALGDPRAERWFGNFLERLLQNSPAVLALMERNPFPDRPPRYARALLYDYHFTTFEERRQTGQWWRRELINVYYPVVLLKK